MLVLSRMRDESLIIGEAGQVLSGPIVITIVDIRGNKCRIGINAPTEIPVHREEVHRAIEREKLSKETGDYIPSDTPLPSDSLFPHRRSTRPE